MERRHAFATAVAVTLVAASSTVAVAAVIGAGSLGFGAGAAADPSEPTTTIEGSSMVSSTDALPTTLPPVVEVRTRTVDDVVHVPAPTAPTRRRLRRNLPRSPRRSLPMTRPIMSERPTKRRLRSARPHLRPRPRWRRLVVGGTGDRAVHDVARTRRRRARGSLDDRSGDGRDDERTRRKPQRGRTQRWHRRLMTDANKSTATSQAERLAPWLASLGTGPHRRYRREVADSDGLGCRHPTAAAVAVAVDPTEADAQSWRDSHTQRRPQHRDVPVHRRCACREPTDVVVPDEGRRSRPDSRRACFREPAERSGRRSGRRADGGRRTAPAPDRRRVQDGASNGLRVRPSARPRRAAGPRSARSAHSRRPAPTAVAATPPPAPRQSSAPPPPPPTAAPPPPPPPITAAPAPPPPPPPPPPPSCSGSKC